MEPWFILRIVGGLTFSVAHRYIVRRAWQESMGWGISAMFVPGLSLFLAYRYRADLRKPLYAQITGIVLVAAGFGMALNHSISEIRSGKSFAEAHTAAPEPETAIVVPAAASAATPTADRPKDLAAWYADLNARRASLTTPEAIEAFNREAAEYQQALRALRKPSAPVAAIVPETAPGLAAPVVTGPERGLYLWHQSIEARRKTLNLADADAVRKFTEETNRYQSACDGTKPLNDQLKPLRDELKPLAGTK